MGDVTHSAVTQQGYARLPEDLLNDLLEGSDSLVQQVEHLLSSTLNNAARLREALESLHVIRELTEEEAATACGVDGGFALERTASVDISLSVAVGVEGLSGRTDHWSGTQYTWWNRVGSHHFDAERLCRGIMAAQELEILYSAPHEYRILDGSHLTPVIQLNSALTVASDELRSAATAQWQARDTAACLADMAGNPRTVAMPKYDSSREICQLLSKALAEEVPGDDKFALSLLLRPNEYIVPQSLVGNSTWEQLHFDSPGADTQSLALQLEEAIRPLRNGGVQFTYFKPDEYSPAFRIELKPRLSSDDFRQLLTTLKHQITGPFVREPYPQYLADVMAKSVGLGLSALGSSVQLSLSGRNQPELAHFLAHSYRTEGI